MSRKTGHSPIGIVLAICAFAAGCNSGNDKVSAEVVTRVPQDAPTTPEATPEPPASSVLKRVSDRPGNVEGQVIVMEWHHIREGKGDMFRSPAAFRKDLETLYSMGFRPVTVSEYLADDMNLAPGDTRGGVMPRYS